MLVSNVLVLVALVDSIPSVVAGLVVVEPLAVESGSGSVVG